ncbi:hypothetical protein CsSME_00015565 [Camellia sinensis var. sinensis]
MVRYSWFTEQFWGIEPKTVEETEQYARSFMMFLLGTTLFVNRANTVRLYLLSALVTLSRLWVYAYFPTLAPEPVVELPLTVPYSRRYDGQLYRRTLELFLFFRHYFDTVVAHEATMPTGIQGQYKVAWGISCYRILLEGPVCRAWFLGEGVVHQTMGLPAPMIPMTPPESMRLADSLSAQEVIQFMVGLEADYFRVEGDYTVFIQIYLMPPLTGVRGGERARAPAARVAPRATRATSARRRGASRTRCTAGAAPGPTVSPLAVGERGKQAPARSRGRARGPQDENGPSEPFLSDDDAETSGSEEAVSPQSESSESGDNNDSKSESGGDAEPGSKAESGDDSGFDLASGSDSGAVGDSFGSPPRKRTKRASRA